MEQGRELLQFLSRLRDDEIAGIAVAILVENSLPILFRAVAGSPPAEIADAIGAVGDGLVSPNAIEGGRRLPSNKLRPARPRRLPAP